MATGKKSFVLYTDQNGIFEKLSDEQAGALIKHIFKYVNDENPEGDFVTELAFESIKQQLKRDLRKFETKREQWSAAGKKSAEARRKKKAESSTDSTDVKTVATDSTVTVNDNVNVNDNNINKVITQNKKVLVDWNKLLKSFNQITGKNCRVVNTKTKNQLKARLKEGYSKEDVMKAIKTCFNEDYHKETNHKHLTLEFITRADKLDKYVNINEKKVKPILNLK